MSLAESIEALKKVDLADLDVNNLGSWPAPVKAITCLLLLIVALLLGYNFYLKDLQGALEKSRTEENTLKEQFSSKAFLAANLEAYKSQMKEMEESFGTLLRQLPSDTEVPGLLEDITRTGLGSGLEFEEIKLQPEVVQQFYIELPIQISVVGGYHDLATFVSGVASLPRIVTLHDFDIKPAEEGSTSKLRMSVLAKTYRYNDAGLKGDAVSAKGAAKAPVPSKGAKK
ncbi:type 4a pilus biogenesis protein PilO [Aquipseudomonas ullengensis]|uniref:Type 4a pilus biogenesis protein PilO n=1 Tax=Aquipseudomonas ullengensis TaxID=2759166 RepID=A0A7W4LIJ9_9GAMM|nr:type 4a pilus biogenesis protein PilO [Pseudomonas ullengensis]MBB2493791.1 type 4a pilus biogenesis protein PilO [Pseudomonas ullengensis]